MPADKLNDKINGLFQREQWEEARSVLTRQRENRPNDHWLLTQLGVTYYEQRRYEEALQWFLKSYEIVPDCPLTLWNLAGALDSLGKHGAALRVFAWLLQNKKSPDDDACWESKQWADALKADCVYRIGVCFRHLGKKRKAWDCFRQYLDLLSLGMEGLYSIDDVKRELSELHGAGGIGRIEGEVRKAVNATLQVSGIGPKKGVRSAAPRLNVRELCR